MSPQAAIPDEQDRLVRFSIKLPRSAFDALRQSGAPRALEARYEAARIVMADLEQRELWQPKGDR